MRVLVTMSHPLKRQIVEHQLKKLGHDISTGISSGQQLLATVEQQRPDLVMLELDHHPLDGTELAYHVLNSTPVRQCVFINTRVNPAEAVISRHIEDITVDFPVSREALSSVIQRAASYSDGINKLFRQGRQRPEYLVTRQGKVTYLLPLAEVWYFRETNHRVYAQTSEGRFLLDDSMASLATRFATGFRQIHAQLLINTEREMLYREDSDGRVYAAFEADRPLYYLDAESPWIVDEFLC